jgi:hypothetical protein
MPMIGGGDCGGGCIVKMMPGTTVAPFPFIRFRNPPLNIQPMASSASQTDKAQVKIKAVVFNQAVQRVKNGIQRFSGI